MLEEYPAPVKLLSRKALTHAAIWIQPQFGQGAHALEPMLDIICLPNETWWMETNRPFFRGLLFHTLRCNHEDPSLTWRIICQFLPGKKSEICTGIVKRYVAMEAGYVINTYSDQEIDKTLIHFHCLQSPCVRYIHI